MMKMAMHLKCMESLVPFLQTEMNHEEQEKAKKAIHPYPDSLEPRFST
jgi:hypothetical protein